MHGLNNRWRADSATDGGEVSGGTAAGYRHDSFAAAAIAAGLAVIAALATPAVRPVAGTRVAVY